MGNWHTLPLYKIPLGISSTRPISAFGEEGDSVQILYKKERKTPPHPQPLGTSTTMVYPNFLLSENFKRSVEDIVRQNVDVRGRSAEEILKQTYNSVKISGIDTYVPLLIYAAVAELLYERLPAERDGIEKEWRRTMTGECKTGFSSTSMCLSCLATGIGVYWLCRRR